MRGEEDLISWMHLSDKMFVYVERGEEKQGRVEN